MLKKIKELLLNTPEKYWLVIGGYHIHKSFWGLVFLLVGFVFLVRQMVGFGVLVLFFGCFVLTISIVGQKYTHGKYKLELWERYSRK